MVFPEIKYFLIVCCFVYINGVRANVAQRAFGTLILAERIVLSISKILIFAVANNKRLMCRRHLYQLSPANEKALALRCMQIGVAGDVDAALKQWLAREGNKKLLSGNNRGIKRLF